MDEFEIIRRYFDRESTEAGVRIGIGDDGAVLTPAPDRELVNVIDTMVAGVHFPESLDPCDIGYRAVAINLSDIAAMAARPRWMTLALTLSDADPSWLEEFARGLFQAADEHDVRLVGGDTTRGGEVVVTVQIIGDVEPSKALTRDGARAGDSIFVTGTPGDAAAGLSILQSGLPRNDDIDYLLARFARPTARVATGNAIASIANAAIDLSDGLFSDIEKLLAASGVSGTIELEALPISPQLSSLMDMEDALRFAVSGGDDYELCFTSSIAETDITAVVGNVPVTRIGSVEEGAGLSCTRSGEPQHYEDAGYRHFH